jgi:hypothetical protein
MKMGLCRKEAEKSNLDERKDKIDMLKQSYLLRNIKQEKKKEWS